jgi:hypothetical protein
MKTIFIGQPNLGLAVQKLFIRDIAFSFNAVSIKKETLSIVYKLEADLNFILQNRKTPQASKYDLDKAIKSLSEDELLELNTWCEEMALKFMV